MLGMFAFLLIVLSILGTSFFGGTLNRFCRFTNSPLIFFDTSGLMAPSPPPEAPEMPLAARVLVVEESKKAAQDRFFIDIKDFSKDGGTVEVQGGLAPVLYSSTAVDASFANATVPAREDELLRLRRVSNLVARYCPLTSICREKLKTKPFFVVWPLDDSSRDLEQLTGITPALSEKLVGSDTPLGRASTRVRNAPRGCGGARVCPLMDETDPVFGVAGRSPVASDSKTSRERTQNAVSVALSENLFQGLNPGNRTFCGSTMAEDYAYGFLATKPESHHVLRTFHFLLLDAGRPTPDPGLPSRTPYPSDIVHIHNVFNLQHSVEFGWGFPVFDNVLRSSLTIFHAISLSNWASILYRFEDSSPVVVARLFFLLLILTGTFFLLNVALAVVCDAFDQVAPKHLRSLKKQKGVAKKELASKVKGREKVTGTESSLVKRMAEKDKLTKR